MPWPRATSGSAPALPPRFFVWLLPMKLETVNLLFKIMVYVLGILPLLLEKASGVGALPHDYVKSFAAKVLYRHLPTTLSEMTNSKFLYLPFNKFMMNLVD